MQIEVGGLLAVCVANVLLSLIVGSRSWRSRENRLFAILSASIAAWSLGIAVFTAEVNPGASQLFFINEYYVAAIGIACALLVFASAWTGANSFRRVAWLSAAVLAAWIAALIAYPHAIVVAVHVMHRTKHVQFNVLGQAVYSLLFLLMFSLAIWQLLRYSYSAGGKRRQNTQVMVRGVVLAGTFGIVCNLVLPWFGNYKWVWVGPQFSMVFVWFIAYLIIRRHLFNIKLAIARSVAYLLALVAVIAAYVGIVVVVADGFKLTSSLTGRDLYFYIGLVALSAVIFHPLKRFFDTATNRWFYKARYESQTLLDKLNDILVSSTDLDALLGRTSKLMDNTLNATFTHFLFESDFSPAVRAKYPLSDADKELVATLSKVPPQLFVTDEQLLSGKSQRLTELLDARGVAVVSRLQTARQRVGYILIGSKHSGEGYLPQDEQVIKLVSDELAITIQSVLRFEEIQNFTQTLQGKVSQATRELRRTNQRLRELDTTKDDFISMASHQLRTPLTSVKGYLSMVLEGDAGDLNDNQRKLLEQSFRSAQQMVYLISDLLNLSRLSTGKFVIEPSAVNLSEIVQFEVSQLAEAARLRDIALKYDKPAAFPVLMLDETKTHQVVMNFIDNAIHYTPSGGTVTVGLRDAPSYVEYTVKDTGIGVPKSARAKLFTKFYRAENAQQERPDGTGLGLFMAKKVVVAQGGAIIFESEEGKGSTFGFRLSKANRSAADQPKGLKHAA